MNSRNYVLTIYHLCFIWNTCLDINLHKKYTQLGLWKTNDFRPHTNLNENLLLIERLSYILFITYRTFYVICPTPIYGILYTSYGTACIVVNIFWLNWESSEILWSWCLVKWRKWNFFSSYTSTVLNLLWAW